MIVFTIVLFIIFKNRLRFVLDLYFYIFQVKIDL